MRRSNKQNKKIKRGKNPGSPKAAAIYDPPSKKQVRKEIAAAISSLPKLVAQKINLDDSRYAEFIASASQKDGGSAAHHAPPKYSGVLLWIGVIAITAVVFIMWFFNAAALFIDVKQTDLKDGELWGAASADFEKIIDSIQKNETASSNSTPASLKSNETEEKIKSILSNLIISTPDNGAAATAGEKIKTED